MPKSAAIRSWLASNLAHDNPAKGVTVATYNPIWDKFSKACGDPRSQHSDADLLCLIRLILDESNTEELVDFVEVNLAGAWNVPAYISLLMLRELRKRGAVLSAQSVWFLRHEADEVPPHE
jgi:hypothetical protein